MDELLTSTHEDYIELVFRGQELHPDGIRITDLAKDLGCRMPTVSRTVRHLADAGYFKHQVRGLVKLTKKGMAVASEIAHRHDDAFQFLHHVLGLPRERAEVDACRLEHGLSPFAAERLHWFLRYLEDLPQTIRTELRRKILKKRKGPLSFEHLQETKTQGWRH